MPPKTRPGSSFGFNCQHICQSSCRSTSQLMASQSISDQCKSCWAHQPWRCTDQEHLIIWLSRQIGTVLIENAEAYLQWWYHWQKLCWIWSTLLICCCHMVPLSLWFLDMRFTPLFGLFPAPRRPSGGCIATVQALSGTGSLQCIAQFLKFMGVTKAGPMMSRAEIERSLFVNQGKALWGLFNFNVFQTQMHLVSEWFRCKAVSLEVPDTFVSLCTNLYFN